jgi:hypothetical protein
MASKFFGTTFLFEYTGPAQQIVIPYTQHRLTLLAMVEHSSHKPILVYCPVKLLAVATRWNFKVNQPMEVPGDDFVEKMEYVSRQENTEGVVVGAFPLTGNPTLIKVKSRWYLTLHTLRTGTSNKQLKAILSLCAIRYGATTLEEVTPYLHDLGMDAETIEVYRARIEDYYKEFAEILKIESDLVVLMSPVRYSTPKEMALFVRELVATGKIPQWSMSLAMGIYYGDEMKRTCQVLGRLTGESPITVQNFWWQGTPEQVLDKSYDEEEADV